MGWGGRKDCGDGKSERCEKGSKGRKHGEHRIEITGGKKDRNISGNGGRGRIKTGGKRKSQGKMGDKLDFLSLPLP